MRDNDDAPAPHTSDDEWPEPPDPFRGVFDFNPWADNGRDTTTGRTIYPVTGFPVALYFDYGGSHRQRAMWF